MRVPTTRQKSITVQGRPPGLACQRITLIPHAKFLVASKEALSFPRVTDHHMTAPQASHGRLLNQRNDSAGSGVVLMGTALPARSSLTRVIQCRTTITAIKALLSKPNGSISCTVRHAPSFSRHEVQTDVNDIAPKSVICCVWMPL